jgi:hypothetical protein
VHRFEVWLKVDASSTLTYRVIETYPCADGIRTRICDGTYTSLKEAEEKAAHYQETVNARH